MAEVVEEQFPVENNDELMSVEAQPAPDPPADNNLEVTLHLFCLLAYYAQAYILLLKSHLFVK